MRDTGDVGMGNWKNEMGKDMEKINTLGFYYLIYRNNLLFS